MKNFKFLSLRNFRIELHVRAYGSNKHFQYQFQLVPTSIPNEQSGFYIVKNQMRSGYKLNWHLQISPVVSGTGSKLRDPRFNIRSSLASIATFITYTHALGLCGHHPQTNVPYESKLTIPINNL